METTYPGKGSTGHLNKNSLIQKPQLKCFSSAVNRARIPMACGKTENLLVSGRPRHFSETFMLSWRCPRPLPYASHGDDAWAMEHPKNENRHCLCRLGWSGAISNYFPCDSLEFMLDTIFFMCLQKRLIKLWVVSISLERRRTFVLLCKCYPTVLAIGGRGK